MGPIKRSTAAGVATVLSAVTLIGCGTEGRIQDYDTVSVWPAADPRGRQPIGQLTTRSKVTVKCVSRGHVDANGMGYGDMYKIDFNDGDGYIDTSTSILTDDGELSPENVDEC
ncbi:hypothetical protein FM076_32170 [Streptomyces albus subsp. chlorinus]|uniref:hypothetical protein n=1 Tax=Streptomyces albus TaxID=1888 RepID=UPI00156EC38A|nr:hypothetical protein [Streptomyces albus]NSC25559.1 hypothetical protein [Streptomyces albus subsp. chlorinus]